MTNRDQRSRDGATTRKGRARDGRPKMDDSGAMDEFLAEFHTPTGATRDLKPGSASFSIRDLCEAFDVTPRALRFYESQGLISPRRDGQRRIYSLRDRARLFLVLRGKRFGFSLAEIRDLLDLYDRGDRQRSQIDAALTSGREKLRLLHERRRDLDEAIGELEAIIGNLNAASAELASDPDASEGPKKRVFGEPVAAAEKS